MMRIFRFLQQLISAIALTALVAFLTGCGGGSSTTPAGPSVTTATVPNATVGTAYSVTIQASGGTAPYTWSVSAGTLPDHLSLSNSTTSSVTLSGTPQTAQSNVQFTIQVKDSANLSATKAYTVNVAASTISVSIQNKIAGILPAAAAVVFNANVQNDSASQGVTWTLTANNADCSPACGSLSGSTATSVVYTPPSAVPSTPNNTPKITATSVTDVSKSDSNTFSITTSPLSACTSSGNEAVLNGKYAFLLQGHQTGGSLAVVGSVTADGSGKFSAGEIDSNGAVVHHDSINTTTSSYSVGADNRGCMTVVTANGTYVVHFAVGKISASVATKGRIIAFDDTVGTGLRASGVLVKQDTASFAAGLSGNYAFSLIGQDSATARFGATGSVTANAGLFSNGEIDTDDAGTTAHVTGAAGLIGVTINANGRGTATLSPATLFPTNFTFYIVSSSQIFLVSSDALSISAPVVSGEMRAQTGAFSNSSLNGVAVFHIGGLDVSGRSAAVGTISANGAGSANIAVYENDAGTVQPVQNFAATYSVAANGRATLTGAGTAPVLYLTAANAGFLGGTDSTVSSGEFEAQAAGPFSSSSLSGAFFFGSDAAASQAEDAVVGVVNLDGSGNLTVTIDTSTSTGLSIDQIVADTLTVNADGTGSTGGNALLVISDSKALTIQGSGANPNVLVIEK